MKILFAPGIGASHRDFPEYCAVFGEDLEIIRYANCVSLDDHLQRINEYITVLEDAGVEYSLIGHSLGAHLSYRYIQEYNPKYLKSLIMIGGGPRFVPLRTWNTIFSMPSLVLRLILVFVVLGAPFLFLVHGWHGMIQRVNVTDIFRREGVRNIHNIYNKTLVPLTTTPMPFTSTIPVLTIRLHNDLLFPKPAFEECRELIHHVDDIVVPRTLIHFSHHLDVLVSGYIHEWLVKTVTLPKRDLPFEVKYAMQYPQSVNVEMEGYAVPRTPFVVLLIIVLLTGLTITFPQFWLTTILIDMLRVIQIGLGINQLPVWISIVALVLLFPIWVVYYHLVTPGLPRESQTMIRTYPRVSIIVPMRNEERNIRSCLSSLLHLEYPEFEIILVDGNSEDQTLRIAEETVIEQNHLRRDVHLLQEPPLPEGWIGKSWACHTGQQAATGDVLLFTDADTTHHASSLKEMITTMQVETLDSLSVIGKMETRSFWEKAILPVFKSILFVIFGGRYTNSRQDKRVLGIGQYILITRSLYDEIGGHNAIKSYISEDIHLVENAAKSGTYAAYNGNSVYTVRMYRSWKEIKEGLGRNSYQSVGGNIMLVILATLGLLLWRLGPFILWLFYLQSNGNAYVNLLCLLLVVFVLGIYYIDLVINYEPWSHIFYLPIGILGIVYILIWGSIRSVGNQSLIWKGRTYSYE